jgi:putative oxidoreductase
MKISNLVLSSRLEPRAVAVGLLFLRLAFGYHLIQYAAPMVFSAADRGEFVEMLSGKGVPWPGFLGLFAIGAEFFGALAFLLGALIRPASALLLINFAVALALVHWNKTYLESFEAIQMFLVSATLLFTGAGALSLDALLFGVTPRRTDGP